MEEKRKYRRVRTCYQVRLSHPCRGSWLGLVANMSEGGVFVSDIDPNEFSIGMELEAMVFGKGWDKAMPSLAMRVIRVEEGGIALMFLEHEFPLMDSGCIPERDQTSYLR